MSANQIERDGNLGLSTLRALSAPVNVLMRDFAVLETDDDGNRHLQALTVGGTPGRSQFIGVVWVKLMKSSSTTPAMVGTRRLPRLQAFRDRLGLQELQQVVWTARL